MPAVVASEAYGGYHFDKMHGIIVGGGIFMSYVGLFSYYNFDNWAYQPSYVSSNKYGLTLGGGAMNNPGRYLVLVPPINGATAFTGTPYFTANSGNPFHAWDASVTFDMMPDQFTTLRVELNHRESRVPYFAGSDGITPAGGNTGSPGSAVAGFTPDLRKTETRINVALLIKL